MNLEKQLSRINARNWWVLQLRGLAAIPFGILAILQPGMIRSGTRGEDCLDIHLNAATRWKDVLEAVWNYTLGGYQVLKKSLSYRVSALLARAPLTSDEAQQFTHHVRRITAILALHEKLDEHYHNSVQ